MIILNGGPNRNLREILLFPFDDGSLPFQRGVRLQLLARRSTSEEGTRIVLPMGAEGAPDCQGVSFYGAVCRVGEELYMWYLGQGPGERTNQKICFARSSDGYQWEKPALGLVEHQGSRQNNLVDLGGGQYPVTALTVLHDVEDTDPQRRFKMVFETHRRKNPLSGRAEFNVAFSADGLRWIECPVTPPDLSCEMSGIARIGDCYYVTAQSGGGHFGPPRKLETFVSYDFEHWCEADCLGFMRGNIPPRPMVYDQHAGEQVHLGAGLWNRGNVIIGVYGQWHGHPTNDRRQVSIDLGLVVANDGLHYREPIPDFRLIAASEDGSGPYAQGRPVVGYPSLEQGQGFENIGEETLYWYGAWSARDGVRVASWGRDRLGYFEACNTGKLRSLQDAHFVSAPINLEDKPARVYLNVGGLSEHTQVQAEILTERFEPLPGYSRGMCLAPTSSGFRQPVRWQAGEVVSHRHGRVRLRVYFGGLRPEDARIYAAYLEEA